MTNSMVNKIESLNLKSYSKSFYTEIKKALKNNSDFITKDEIYRLNDYIENKLVYRFFETDRK